jgi:long-chain acyl-CoA synthetase
LALRGFWIAAEQEPERPALVDPAGGVHTAGALGAAANRLVHGLRARGLRAGDGVAVVLPNGVELVEVLLAAMQAGWHYTAINSHLTAGEISYILENSGAKAFFADARQAELAHEAADRAGLAAGARFAVGAIPGFTAFGELMDGRPATRPEDRLAGQFMQYTSGTTGRPKAVQRAIPALDPETMVAAWAPNLARYDVEPGGDHVHLVTSPMYHMAPLAFGYLSLHFEHRVVLMERFDAEEALGLVERHRVTTTHMVPTQFHRLLRLPEAVRRRHDVSSLRNVMHAAAPCPVELKRQLFAWWGPVIYEYYGATEGGGTIAKPGDWLRFPGTVGRAWPGSDVKILDDDGRELPPGEIGTVYMKNVMAFEYKGDPEKTRAARRGDYFTVGDVGELNAEGFLFLRDRKIDMIISGGVNVYPAEVEAALLAHPQVADAAVFGIPHAEWGEEVKAVVEPAPGAGAELAAELLAFCRARLAAYKCPRSIDLVAALPRDPNGKLYKRRLRDPYWAGHARRI